MPDGYHALRHGLVAVDPARDLVRLAGPDAGAYLQGQLSQDVAGLAPGASARSWLLAPNGKVDALVRVTRLEADAWLVDTERGWGDAVEARLGRFKLRSAFDLDRPPWRAVGLRGPAAAGTAPGEGTAVAVDAGWPGLPGVDWIGPEPVVAAGIEVVADEVLERARIEAGIPRMGSELDERTIPAETGLVEATVSFTKGCYTGQELVARIDSRGSNVARRLRGVRAPGRVQPGDELVASGKRVGVLTSAAPADNGRWVALAYVARAVAPPAEVELTGERPNDPVTVEVLELPLTG